VADAKALQAAADALSAKLIRTRLDYWTLIVGLKFSKKDRQAEEHYYDVSVNRDRRTAKRKLRCLVNHVRRLTQQKQNLPELLRADAVPHATAYLKHVTVSKTGSSLKAKLIFGK
jgi:hypothetical protein